MWRSCFGKIWPLLPMPDRGLQLLIDDGGGRMRWLGVGSEFKDGWKVDRFDRQKVVLRRGKDTRSISLFTRVQQSPLGK